MAITKTNCPPVNTCDACKEIVKSNCVKYSGVNITCAGITNGTTLTNIIVDLASSICELSATTNASCNVIQGCVKLHRNGDLLGEPRYNFFSCSAPIHAGCTKTYSIFDTDDVNLFTGSLAECQGLAINPSSGLELETPYYIVEYVDCGDCGTSESLNQCFQIYATEAGRVIQNSCDCCPGAKPI